MIHGAASTCNSILKKSQTTHKYVRCLGLRHSFVRKRYSRQTELLGQRHVHTNRQRRRDKEERTLFVSGHTKVGWRAVLCLTASLLSWFSVVYFTSGVLCSLFFWLKRVHNKQRNPDVLGHSSSSASGRSSSPYSPPSPPHPPLAPPPSCKAYQPHEFYPATLAVPPMLWGCWRLLFVLFVSAVSVLPTFCGRFKRSFFFTRHPFLCDTTSTILYNNYIASRILYA